MEERTNHHIDQVVEDEISHCLDLNAPKSFFLFAGAGSGKTRSLVRALKHVEKHYGEQLILSGQKVGVITYTNAACDEIQSRIDYNKLFSVSTIHSFAWDLIKSFTTDIKSRVQSQIEISLIDLEDKQSRSRGANKTSIDRARKIESKKRRLAHLAQVTKFTYSPQGDNKGKDTLNHAEVIDLISYFLLEKKQMQSILIRKFPILLIDESQDTNKLLIDSLFAVESDSKGKFALGLFGDMMQRIYLEGKANLGKDTIPPDWKTPTKKLNHRCPTRVVELLNKIRCNVDGQQQEPRTDAIKGTVRLFIVSEKDTSKMDIENSIAQKMADLAGDELWVGDKADVQTLTLEHHMSSKRMGFSQLFEPLYNISYLKTNVLNGTDSGLRFFHNIILPLYEALNENDKFSVARIIKKHSELVQIQRLRSNHNQIGQFETAQKAVEEFFTLWQDGHDPILLDILKNIQASGLLPLPEILSIIAKRTEADMKTIEETNETTDEDFDEIIDAWDIALQAPFSQVGLYSKYISGEGNFDTHQGVKGREFERVMVILDDEEARGYSFSYDKLLGVKPPSANDKKNREEGKETGFDRTLRLFYVTCSRAKISLAIVAYTDSPEELTAYVLEDEWFTSEEIIPI